VLSYYKDGYALQEDAFPVASREWQRLVSLPLHSGLSDDDVDDVIEAVTEIVTSNRR
jgi:dTDP-4-amino-4,6-dideoxygalactose transaminase